jgi:multiple sugar transport system substrate-binding protein
MDTSDEKDELSGISRRDLLVRGGQVAAGIAVGGTVLDRFGSTALAAKTETITVLEHQPLRLQLMKKVVPHFEALTKAAGKPIKVNVQAGPTDDGQFITKLTLDYAEGVGPDVTSYGVGNTPDFIAANYLKTIGRNVAGWHDWFSQFYPIVRNDATLKGHVYFVPREVGVLSLYYRHDILKAHGISTAQPKTWNDLLNRAREIKKKTGLHAGAGGNPGAGVLLFPAGTQWGGGSFEEGFIHLLLGTKSKLYDTRTNKWVCKSKGLLDVFTFYHTIAKEGLLPVPGLLAPNPWVPTKYKAFPAGDLTITTSGTWAWEFDWGPHGAAPIPDIFHKVATWQFPTNHGGHPFVYAGPGWVWAIPRRDNSARQAAAFRFVEFMMNPRIVSQAVAQIGNISPRKDAKLYPPYSKLPYLYNTEKELTTGQYFHPQTDQSKMYQLVGQATQNLITLAKSPQQALNDFYNGAISLLGAGKVEVGK